MKHQDDQVGAETSPQDQAQDDPQLRKLLDDYLQMYATRDDRLTTYFSENFSGFTGGGDFLVKDKAEWVAITRQDFAQVKEALRLELKDVAIQSLAETVAVATSFFTIHLPIKDHILSRETARLVLIFRKESGGWKITHSSISIPYHGVGAGEVYPLKDLADRNRFLEEQVAERTVQLSQANDNLCETNANLAKANTEHERTERKLEELLNRRTQELREATANALRAGADEEDRIGQELHDTLCPELIGLARHSENLAARSDLPADLVAWMRDLAGQAGLAARRARDLSHLLARPDVVNASFPDLLRAQLHRMEIALSVACELTLDDAFPELNSEQCDHLIRIVREAVANAVRHAGACRIWVDCVRQGDCVMVSISNDGKPLPPFETLIEGLGLRQIRMRADLLGASLALRAGHAGGAVVELAFSMPLIKPIDTGNV